MIIQNNNNKLNYLTDLIFTKFNRFFFPFERIEKNNVKKDQRYSFSHYQVPNVEIKDFNVFIDRKRFFDSPVKIDEEAYEKIIEISKNNDYTTDNLLDLAYFRENYRLIAIDLSKPIKLKDPQKSNFIGKLEDQNNEATISSLKNRKKLLLNFYKIL